MKLEKVKTGRDKGNNSGILVFIFFIIIGFSDLTSQKQK